MFVLLSSGEGDRVGSTVVLCGVALGDFLAQKWVWDGFCLSRTAFLGVVLDHRAALGVALGFCW